jgi:hypothetical protein
MMTRASAWSAGLTTAARSAVALEPVGERLALDVPHDEVQRVGRLPEGVEWHDVRVHEPRGDARLASEALAYVGGFDRFAGKNLDRDHAVEGPLAREPDRAHPAASEEAEHVILPRELGGELRGEVVGGRRCHRAP